MNTHPEFSFSTRRQRETNKLTTYFLTMVRCRELPLCHARHPEADITQDSDDEEILIAEAWRLARSFLHTDGPISSVWTPRVRGDTAAAPRSRVEGAAATPIATPSNPRVCSACSGYYGPAFSQPVCATCHAFLYANDLDAEVNLQIMSQAAEEPEGPRGEGHGDDSDRDSGNEEPTDQDQDQNVLAEEEEESGGEQDQEEGAQVVVIPPVAVAVNQMPDQAAAEEAPEGQIIEEPVEQDDMAGAGAGPSLDYDAGRDDDEDGGPDWEEVLMLPWDQHAPLLSYAHMQQPQFINVESLSKRLALLSFARPSDTISEGIVANLPPEVLLIIFSFLDDLSLYAVGNVCTRWNEILKSKVAPEQWQVYTRRRWPLFKPLLKVMDWFTTYTALVESSFCLTCLHQMAEVIPADFSSLPLREKRLVHDLRLLVEDPPPGIKAQPLDSSNYHWQASITGPVGSPYEGGLFFLYLKVPFQFPFDPPEVRFLTRIFHPNVSRHGDVGIDIILQHNWVSGLTIPKVLISIQSLLTDPYCKVSMEPEVGSLYRNNRKLFDAVARIWTWQFAMHDAVTPKPIMQT